MVGISSDSIGFISLRFPEKKIKNLNYPDTGTVRKLDKILYFVCVTV